MAEQFVEDDPQYAATLPLTTQPPTYAQSTVLTPREPPSDVCLKVGNLLDERYKVLDVRGGPGVSGMGVVYVVESDGNRFAAKTFQHQFSQNLSLIERFLREARTWILTGFHPNIVHAYFIDIVEACPYLFMEYVESNARGTVSLADNLRDGSLSMRDALDLAIQCCDGMIHATKLVPGLVHRDLKPENLLIAADGTLKITDFGLVRCHIAEEIKLDHVVEGNGKDDLTQVGAAFGTPAYMAPEQFVEAGSVSQVADIYAFGCCFYEAISGQRLFTIRTDTPIEHLLAMRRFHQSEPPVPLHDRVKECPQELDRVIMRCLEKDPGDRWQTFEEVRERLLFVYERTLGSSYVSRTMPEPTRAQIDIQEKSLTLLDGYHRAVRLRNLRENQDASPYAFHLALASFFHCAEEYAEEGRQLEKALRVLGPNQGYEVVRRLGELQVQSGELDKAERLLNDFLLAHPHDLDRCLEPYVYLRVAQGDFAGAEKLLEAFTPNWRISMLRARVLRKAGKIQELSSLLEGQVDQAISEIKSDLDSIESDSPVGWEYDGDVHVLKKVMAALAPEYDLSALDSATHAVWPDLDAYPDLSAEMAWLSDALGGLSELGTVSPCKGITYGDLARLLGYPNRLPRHLSRDETWFWMSKGNELESK
ncbi:MAG: protein kinase [Candidatus Hydrogenedentes bacterium]|nr:protein kinase [Candidatus Hydrogenedentota bacterium]